LLTNPRRAFSASELSYLSRSPRLFCQRRLVFAPLAAAGFPAHALSFAASISRPAKRRPLADYR